MPDALPNRQVWVSWSGRVPGPRQGEEESFLMGKTAFLFPGQGSQSVGMADHLTGYREAASMLERAEELTGVEGLRGLISEGPADLLTRTDNVQPAITLVSLAILGVLQKRGLSPDGVAGHSLGEYAALVAAGSLEAGEALELVRHRGRLMQECADRSPGGMLALLGVDPGVAGKLVAECSTLGPIGIANINSAGQVVLSGASEPLQRAAERAGETGVRRIIPLRVSGAWHSPLMRDAADGLLDYLEAAAFRDPGVEFVANVTSDFVTTAADCRRYLYEQVTSPVLWADSMGRLVGNGFDTFVEVGPGRVLRGLMRSFESVSLYGTGSSEELERVLEELC